MPSWKKTLGMFTLDYYFTAHHGKESITFKGGTSLQKPSPDQPVSEDIDLILDWRVLGYGKR